MGTLLTGGSGLLGSELKRHFNDFYAPPHATLDIRRPLNLTREYKLIVHCAAYTDVAGAEEDMAVCEDTNVVGTMNVCMAAAKEKAKVVYISTDYVYPGTTGNYKETDDTKPINFYAYSKWMGEKVISTYRYDWLIIRTSFKPSKWPYANVFDDIYTSADYVDVIAEKIAFLIKSGECGIYNVGTERKNLYELAKLRNPEVKPISSINWPDVNMPKDCSMDCSKFEELVKSEGYTYA